MSIFHFSPTCVFILSCVVLIVGMAQPAKAQAVSTPPDALAQDAAQSTRRTPDFLFGRPRGSLGIRGSWLFASAGSDLFDFVRNQLTIDERDFDAPAIGADLAIAVHPRVDAVFGIDFSRTQTASEYRDYVDSNRLPITQDTRLTQVNLSGSARLALLPRGHEVSRFAWIPRAVTPYVGAGAGFLWYAFQQDGDFVDFLDLSVFSDSFRSNGWTPSAHVFGGVDTKIWRRLFLTVEGRYAWASAELDRDFSGFDPIDLDGLKVAAGINVLF